MIKLSTNRNKEFADRFKRAFSIFLFLLSSIQWPLFLLGTGWSYSLYAQTIAEKKAGITPGISGLDKFTQQQLARVNRQLSDKENELKRLYLEVRVLYSQHASESSFKDLRDKINQAKVEIADIENTWRDTTMETNQGEGYALWQQPATTIEQLVIDYGSQEYVYVIPPDIGAKKVSIASSMPIPKALWTQMLEMILLQHGIAVHQLNPYLRQLVLTKDNQGAGMQLITNRREDLELMPKEARVGFVIEPDPSEVRRVAYFLEKFVNGNTTTISIVGRDMLIVSPVGELQELLKLYDFVATSRGDTEYKLKPMTKVAAKDMADILNAMFAQFAAEEQSAAQTAAESSPGGKNSKSGSSNTGVVVTTPSKKNSDNYGLRVIPLIDVAQAVFLIGTKDEIQKAEEIIAEVEGQVGAARSKVVYTYRAKHSDPEDLGKLLSQIYNLLLAENITSQRGGPPPFGQQQAQQQRLASDQRTNLVVTQNPPNYPPNSDSIYTQAFPTAPSTVDDTTGFYQSGAVVINPAPVLLDKPKTKEVNKGRDNFLVDPKSSNIVMVVDPGLLDRLKELIKRIDVPPKMVQLDVLLFEKSINNASDYGMNLMRIGGDASNSELTTVTFNNDGSAINPCGAICAAATGVLQFFVSRPRGHGYPAFDWAYRFLMHQDDIVINANPSVVTLNQVPASISILDEQSIDTGVVQVSTGGTGPGSVVAKDAYTRAQYGTNIVITPTIHSNSDDPEMLWDRSPDYITLENQLVFDTQQASNVSRPVVTRRKVQNQVRVADGQTVIIGGLRKKNITDSRDYIPFLGEIPCLGKLFSNTMSQDTTTEMFIFITPTILYDPCDGFEKIKMQQLVRRPGDVPYYMCSLESARCRARESCFARTLDMICGREQDRCIRFGDDTCPRQQERAEWGASLFRHALWGSHRTRELLWDQQAQAIILKFQPRLNLRLVRSSSGRG